MLLAGDLGGTKTRLALIDPARGPRQPVADVTLPSGDYESLEALVRAFLAQVGAPPVTAASIGVAGPVVGGRATITNLPWVMTEAGLGAALGIPTVRLLNDLAALANALPHLAPDDLHTLYAGQPEPQGALAVVAPGTGLGEAFLTWDGARYQAHASEGGHATFAPADARQLALLRYLLTRFDHVSVERVCSGIGLPNLYAFLRDSGQGEEPAWLAAALATADDPTPPIVNAALGATPVPLCAATLELFVAILGAEAGNLALKVLATGGIYLGGGIPPRILPALTPARFRQALLHKGRLSEVLARIPVHVILNQDVGLLGAAYAGLGQ